jgi:glycosyltransferase involved in cell wall biosynthesis
MSKIKHKPTNILYVIHGYPPRQHAGTENYSYSLAKEIANNEFRVGSFYPVYHPKITDVTLDIKQIENHTAFEAKINTIDTLNNIFNDEMEKLFQKAINKFNPDIIHFQHIHTLLPFSLITQSISQRIPTCITLHDFWYICPKTYMLNDDGSLCCGPTSAEKCTECYLTSESKELKDDSKIFFYISELFKKRLEISRLIFSKANLTSSPSKFVLDQYKQYVSFRQDLKIPLGLDTSIINQKRDSFDFVRFGFLGNIAPLKNTHGLIQSFINTAGSAELHIYGKPRNDSFFNELKQMASKDHRIIFHGPYTPNKLDTILSQIDVGIVPSFFENYPLVAREFLSAGIPVIASRVGGLPEIVTHNINGLLFNPLNNHELTHIIQDLIDNPYKIQNLAKKIPKTKSIKQDALVWGDIYKSLYI